MQLGALKAGAEPQDSETDEDTPVPGVAQKKKKKKKIKTQTQTEADKATALSAEKQSKEKWQTICASDSMRFDWRDKPSLTMVTDSDVLDEILHGRASLAQVQPQTWRSFSVLVSRAEMILKKGFVTHGADLALWMARTAISKVPAWSTARSWCSFRPSRCTEKVRYGDGVNFSMRFSRSRPLVQR